MADPGFYHRNYALNADKGVGYPHVVDIELYQQLYPNRNPELTLADALATWMYNYFEYTKALDIFLNPKLY